MTVNVRLIAVAFAAAAFIACTNTETEEPPALRSEPDGTESRASKTKGADVSTGEEALEDGTTEEPLPGLPQTDPAPGASPAPTPPQSTSPLCGKSLTCTAVSAGGSKACRMQETSTGDVYCCPRIGDRIVDGVCVAKLCGSGLTCATTATSGATTCRMGTSATSDSYCCPIAGWRIVNGQCIPPLCGSGLTCSGSPTVGAPACRQTTTSTTSVYCCTTPGQQIVDGKCQ